MTNRKVELILTYMDLVSASPRVSRALLTPMFHQNN